jgi:hypothetical protein
VVQRTAENRQGTVEHRDFHRRGRKEPHHFGSGSDGYDADTDVQLKKQVSFTVLCKDVTVYNDAGVCS